MPDYPPESRKGESPAPGAMGRLLALLAERIGVERMDRLWLFPPLIRGRKEWGLVAVSCHTQDPPKRELITGRYLAELTGLGISFQPEVTSEGLAPPDRLPRVMDGVVRRSDLQLEVPREVELGGDLSLFESLLRDYETDDSVSNT